MKKSKNGLQGWLIKCVRGVKCYLASVSYQDIKDLHMFVMVFDSGSITILY